MSFRTDENNNPAAITTDVAAQGGLVYQKDYEHGTPFPNGRPFVTAKLIGDPVALTIRVIDAIGYQTQEGVPRWSYINLPTFVWDALTPLQKRDVIGYHYRHEGGIAMKNLFPNYSTK